MAIPKLEDDVKIISQIPNYPGSEGGLTPDEFKAKFDEAPQIIKDYINNILIPKMDETVDVQALLNAILDDTLTLSTKAAQAKTTGDALKKKLDLAGGTMSGPINMGSKKLTGLAEPVGKTDAVPKGYLETFVTGKRKSVAITLTASGWKNNFQTVLVDGVTADETKTDVIASVKPDNFEAYNDASILLYTQTDGGVTFKCENVPETDIPVNLLILM